MDIKHTRSSRLARATIEGHEVQYAAAARVVMWLHHYRYYHLHQRRIYSILNLPWPSSGESS